MSKQLRPYEIIGVTAARWVRDYVIEFQFNDGFSRELDLQSQLWGPVFTPLADLDTFKNFRVEDNTIRWSNGADFCPDVLRYWCEVGEIRSQGETDRHFEESAVARET